MPLSCFKGHKPALGIQQVASLKLGIVNFAQKRSVKTSYTVWQWFSQQAIAHDVLPITQLKAETLVAAQSDVKQLCQPPCAMLMIGVMSACYYQIAREPQITTII
jgi:hypothetical protein